MSHEKEDDYLHDLAVKGQQSGYLTAKEFKEHFDQIICSKLTSILEDFWQALNPVYHNLEIRHTRTLWITIVSDKFEGMGIQNRTHFLTDLLAQKAPQVFYGWLFGFIAFTPEEWEKVKNENDII